MTNSSSSLIVKQDYKLVNAEYKLSLNETKLVCRALTMLSDKDKPNCEYSLQASEIMDAFDTENSYTQISDLCTSILTKPLKIKMENGKLLHANWFSSLKYLNGVIEFRIDSDLKPLLYQLKERYTIYSIENITPMRSNYSIRIYQFLKEYQKVGNRKFKVVELMQILQVSDSLKQYNQFKRRVLAISIKEINEYTDLIIKLKEHKSGRGGKVEEITFTIITKAQAPSKKDQSRIAYLLENVPEKHLEKVKTVVVQFLDLEDHIIKSNIAYTFDRKPNKNVTGYLFKALKDDYAATDRLLAEQAELDAKNRSLRYEAELCYNTFANRICRDSGCFEGNEVYCDLCPGRNSPTYQFVR